MDAEARRHRQLGGGWRGDLLARCGQLRTVDHRTRDGRRWRALTSSRRQLRNIEASASPISRRYRAYPCPGRLTAGDLGDLTRWAPSTLPRPDLPHRPSCVTLVASTAKGPVRVPDLKGRIRAARQTRGDHFAGLVKGAAQQPGAVTLAQADAGRSFDSRPHLNARQLFRRPVKRKP